MGRGRHGAASDEGNLPYLRADNFVKRLLCVTPDDALRGAHESAGVLARPSPLRATGAAGGAGRLSPPTVTRPSTSRLFDPCHRNGRPPSPRSKPSGAASASWLAGLRPPDFRRWARI